jgi:glycosyltransferase involved in cell wall biosynthesis
MSGEPAADSISVVLPVRNGERYVVSAITSILDQAVADLEVLVIENGSDDETPALLQAMARQDVRLTILDAGPIGLVRALNLGVSMARGRFIARMDADDVAAPGRLAAEMRALQASPEVVAVGTGYRYVDDSGAPIGQRRVATAPNGVAASLHFGNPIAHPSVMFDRKRIGSELWYSDDYPDAEDFELWLRLTRHHRIANLRSVLLDHRLHAGAVSTAPSRGRASSITALVEASPWPRAVSRWIHERTFSAVQGGVGVVSFVVATLALNAVNLFRPMSPRCALARRSVLALSSVGRARLAPRRLRGRVAPPDLSCR